MIIVYIYYRFNLKNIAIVNDICSKLCVIVLFIKVIMNSHYFIIRHYVGLVNVLPLITTLKA